MRWLALCRGAVACTAFVPILAGPAAQAHPLPPCCNPPEREFVPWREQRRGPDSSSEVLMRYSRVGRRRRGQSLKDSEEQPGECVPRCALDGLARVDGGGRGDRRVGAGSCEQGGDLKLVSEFLLSLSAQPACLRLSSLRHLPRVPPFLYTVARLRTWRCLSVPRWVAGR
jgi:hypothetical protein